MFFEKVEEMGHLGESWIPSSTALNIFSADATSHCAGGPLPGRTSCWPCVVYMTTQFIN